MSCNEAASTFFFFCAEVASTLIFVMKLCQRLHLHWSITITFSNEAILALVFVMKPYQHSHLPWSRTNIRLCHKVTLTLVLVMKLHQHSSLPCSCINTCLSNEVALTLVFALKPCEHSTLPWCHVNTCIRTEAAPTFITMMLPWASMCGHKLRRSRPPISRLSKLDHQFRKQTLPLNLADLDLQNLEKLASNNHTPIPMCR